MAVDRSPVAAAPPSTLRPATLAPPPESEATFDERWAAWQAKGAAHDRALRRKLALAVPIAIIVFAGIVFALLR
jgi:hypothetical protein